MIRSSPSLLKGARRFALLTSLALVLSACSLFSDSDSDSQLPLVDYAVADAKDLAEGGTLTLGVEFMPRNLNPLHTDGIDTDAPKVLAPTFGSAVRVLADGQWEVDSNYAKRVSVVDRKPLVIEVELEPKAVWEGGKPIRSQDMVAFVKAMQNSNYHVAPHPAFNDIESVDVESDLIYQVKFKRVNTDWPAAIYPILPSSVSSSRESFNTGFIDRAVPANGPFQVADVSAETSTIRLERNPHWWGKKPALAQIVWRFAEPDVLATAFEQGDVDVAPLRHVTEKKAPQGGELRVSASSYWSQVTLNGGRGPLVDAKVRQAIALALNREEFAQDQVKYLGVSGVPLDTVVTMPGQFGHRAAETEQDLGEAEELLEAAGWKISKNKATKGGKPLELVLPIPEKQEVPERRAKLITSQLAEIGITVKTEVVAADTFYAKRVIPMDFDLVTFTRRSSAFNVSRSRQWFTPLDSPENFTGKASKAIGSAFKAAVVELDDEDRADANEKLEKIASAQASLLPLVVIPSAWVIREGVVNYGPTQFEQLDWTLVGWHKDFQEK